MQRASVVEEGRAFIAEGSIVSLSGRRPKVLAIGVSTGGPAALAGLLAACPRDFPLPIVIVQHLPAFFTRLLAERLSLHGGLPVLEAKAGMTVRRGKALLAPGDFHLRLVRRGTEVEVALTQDPPEHSCRPAVDVLFRSLAETYGGAVIAVVLTGMGQDGLLGARLLKSLGASVLVQDRKTSVVWGMPGAIAEAQLADEVLPLDQILPAVLRRIGRGDG
jgi:two-component system, chemotaxis family, protein-glutamate methylesterase/glutaminase